MTRDHTYLYSPALIRTCPTHLHQAHHAAAEAAPGTALVLPDIVDREEADDDGLAEEGFLGDLQSSLSTGGDKGKSMHNVSEG